MKLQLQETRINVNKYTRLVQKMIAMFSVNVGNITVLSQRKCVTVVSKMRIKCEIIFHRESVIAHIHGAVKWVISSAFLCKSYNCEALGPLCSKRGFYSNMKLSLLSVKVFYRKKPKFKERRKSSKSKLRYPSYHYINTPFNTCKLSCLFF